jgi:hypothetical protein
MDANRPDRIDQWLDSALSQYAKAEPRHGFEDRILANLAAERRRIALACRWWWLVAVPAMAVLVCVVGWAIHQQLRDSKVSPVASYHSNQDQTGNRNPQVPSSPHSTDLPPQHAAKNASRRHGIAKQGPKLEQFPAPAPLSEQEKLLARYVEQFPQRAVIVARAQTELHERNEREMAVPWPQSSNSDGSE